MADLSDFLYHCLQPFVIDPETSLYNETRLDKRTCFSKHHVLLPPLQLKSSCFTSYSTFAWLESSSGLSRLCCSHWTTTNQPIRIELLLQVNRHHLVSIPIFFLNSIELQALLVLLQPIRASKLLQRECLCSASSLLSLSWDEAAASDLCRLG